MKLGFWTWRREKIGAARAAVNVLRFGRISAATKTTREIASEGRTLSRFANGGRSRASRFYLVRAARKLLFGR